VRWRIRGSPLGRHSDLGIIYKYRAASGLSIDEATKTKSMIKEKTLSLHRLDSLNRSHLLLYRNKVSAAAGVFQRGGEQMR
jgi:hypothetical protein